MPQKLVKTNTDNKLVKTTYVTSNGNVRPKRPPKTLKERAFVKEYIKNGGNKVQAALATYDTKNYTAASRIGHENTEKLVFTDILEKNGVTDDLLAKVAKDGLDATKRTTSLTEPDKVDPDYAVRHKYLETTLKLKKHLNNDEEAGSKHYHVHMTDKKATYNV